MECVNAHLMQVALGVAALMVLAFQLAPVAVAVPQAGRAVIHPVVLRATVRPQTSVSPVKAVGPLMATVYTVLAFGEAATTASAHASLTVIVELGSDACLAHVLMGAPAMAEVAAAPGHAAIRAAGAFAMALRPRSASIVPAAGRCPAIAIFPHAGAAAMMARASVSQTVPAPAGRPACRDPVQCLGSQVPAVGVAATATAAARFRHAKEVSGRFGRASVQLLPVPSPALGATHRATAATACCAAPASWAELLQALLEARMDNASRRRRGPPT